MARNKPHDTVQQHQSAMKAQDDSLMEGGSSGQPPDPMSTIMGMGSIPEESIDDSPPMILKKYRVVMGGLITINGVKTILRPGKIFKESDYDIQKLVCQGIQLVELEPVQPVQSLEPVQPIT